MAHAFCCFFMTGLIWLIQILHYPTYQYIDPVKFLDFQRFHTATITFIVAPIMVIELFSGVFILFNEKFSFFGSLNFLGLILILLATAFLSVPAHNKLSIEFNLETVQFLIQSNWVRTIFWSLRSVLILRFFIQLLEGHQVVFLK
jgi:hypothetical protein